MDGKPTKAKLKWLLDEFNRIHGSEEAFNEIQEGFDTLDEIAEED